MSRNRSQRSKNVKSKNVQHSTIEQHHHIGKTLIPPLANIPKLKLNSWCNDRLPEMLWSILLITHLPREQAITIFRKLGDHIHENMDKGASHEVTLSGLAKLEPSILLKTLKVITNTNESKDILSCLLLFSDLPAKEIWQQVLYPVDANEGWKHLMVSVAKTLNHQSQESTDCRWLRIYSMMAAGNLHLQNEEIAKEFLYYPDYGDINAVGPSIRSAEGAFDSIHDDIKYQWSDKFWIQCYKDTECFPLFTKTEIPLIIGTTPEHVKQIYSLLVKHCNKTNTTTSGDPKHEIIFGFALYCLSILQELLRIGASQSISARITLRTLSECYITLAYLVEKNDPDLWKTYRVYGAGQAKLQYLKLEEVDVFPTYVDIETLKSLSGEDIWEEFLPIDLGHWSNADLRNLSIDAGVKDIYDKYYGWTSSFAHGHWSSMRETIYDICGNPLHRLHRIPRNTSRLLPDVIPDACELIDKILETIDNCYPHFSNRITISK